MTATFKQLFPMLLFLWKHAPQRLKYVVAGLALVAGLSRNLVMLIVNEAAAAPIDQALSKWLPLFILAFVIVVGSSFLYQVITTVATTHVINNVRLKLIARILKAQPSFLDKREHGALYHIMTTDVSIVAGFTNTVLNLLPSFIFLAMAIPQLFSYSVIAGCFVVLVMIGGALAYHLQQTAMATLNADARALEVTYFERVSEMLRGFRELRLHHNRRQSFSVDVSQVLAMLRRLQIKVTQVYETAESAVIGLKFLLFGGIVFLVPYLVQTDPVVTLQIIVFVVYSLNPFEQIITSYPSAIGAIVAYVRIGDLVNDLEPFDRIPDRPVETAIPFSKITLRNIHAKYDSRESSSFELGPLDFELKRGEVVFLVGSNGSGKTTFMNVLAGLLDPMSGTIEVDGVALKPEDMNEYRAQFSAIFTTFHVFRQLYGLEGTSAELADETVERVRLSGITSIRSEGISRLDLSAGQRRRLALAIALLEDRNVMILDEFVADQDPEQREYFFGTLLPWLKSRGKTLVISTHDLHWLPYCDRVLTFQNGKVTEQVPEKPERMAAAS